MDLDDIVKVNQEMLAAIKEGERTKTRALITAAVVQGISTRVRLDCTSGLNEEIAKESVALADTVLRELNKGRVPFGYYVKEGGYMLPNDVESSQGTAKNLASKGYTIIPLYME